LPRNDKSDERKVNDGMHGKVLEIDIFMLFEWQDKIIIIYRLDKRSSERSDTGGKWKCWIVEKLTLL
jgi:hypothetical protein